MKPGMALAVSAGVAVLSGAGLYAHVERERARATGEEATTPYACAARPLRAGTVLEPEDLRIVRFPRRSPPSSAVEAAAASHLTGRTLLRDRRAGEPILWLDIPSAGRDLADRIPLGQRAVTIQVTDTSGLSGLLRARDRVDVFGILPEEGEAGGTGGSGGPGERPGRISRLLLANVTVLAAGAGPLDRESPPPTGYATVTLAVKPAEAQLLALAEREGDLFLALRHPEDVEDPEGAVEVRTRHLYAPERLSQLREAARERIEIYKQGLLASPRKE